MENRIDAELTPEVKAQIISKVKEIKTLLPFLIKLSDSERKSLQMMDDGRKPFTEKAFESADANDAINPGPELIANGEKDLDLSSGLYSIEIELMQLAEAIRDTRQLAGAEAYEVARFVYMKAKMADKMNVPGIKTIVQELSKLFKQTSSDDKKEK